MAYVQIQVLTDTILHYVAIYIFSFRYFVIKKLCKLVASRQNVMDWGAHLLLLAATIVLGCEWRGRRGLVVRHTHKVEENIELENLTNRQINIGWLFCFQTEEKGTREK